MAPTLMTDPFAPGLLQRLPEPPRKVVVLRASRIGDFVCATPALRALRTALPRAEITFIGLPFVHDLVARLPTVDRFIEFPGFPGIAEQFFVAQTTTHFFSAMQAEGFDLAIQLHGSGAYSNPFTLLLGARYTAGFVRSPDRGDLLDAALVMPQADVHEIQRLLALMRFLGAGTDDPRPEFPLWPDDESRAEARLAGIKLPLIGVQIGARARTKQWPHDRFAAAARQLQQKYGGTVVIIGGSDKSIDAESMARRIGAPCLNLVGQLSLPQLGAVIARLNVLLTNDSGPAHIAYALGTPSITIFGSTDARTWGPPVGPHRLLAHPVSCRPCDHAICPIGNRCLQAVEVSTVVEAAKDLLQDLRMPQAAAGPQ